MPRTDRLFHLVQVLQERTVWTARQLAKALRVSERTIYRDVRELARIGVPIKSESGVGYLLLPGRAMPPVALTPDEIEALVLGCRMVAAWADSDLGAAAQSVVRKVSPGSDPHGTPLFAPSPPSTPSRGSALADLRVAIRTRRRVSFAYTRADGMTHDRTVRPLGLFFWGAKWTVVGWCELRGDFRSFRVDRTRHLVVAHDHFAVDAGHTLADFWEYVVAHRSSGTHAGPDGRAD